ncbi:splicing factor 3A subunit 3 [Babesia microti strain RI]|uniref:Splicing factor 3A subunit 3 n=1 Tax=Babesia microti (strain RI) TaxID=1133968 RepID=I7JA43_BABMR|nr:splicing factor 3A subunit 3 [Babesia microti strain RI]CCF73609.1 splicing factor 3A subunit 3 [Babesia microti strain RI]|eukprot:XP_012648218.1 splicing factor 3A subunit 3 [Babesia microti strain RI]
MSGVLEQLRAGHEEIELIEKSISKLLGDRHKKPGKRFVAERAALTLLDEASATAERIGKGDDVWTNFYDKLKGIRDYYKRFEHLNVAHGNVKLVQKIVEQAYAQVDLSLIFTANESGGRTLDLNEHYIAYLNLTVLKKAREARHHSLEIDRIRRKGITDPEVIQRKISPFVEIDYIQYLKTYHKFNDIPRHCKYAVPEYEKYLDNLLNYLYDFFQRQNALSDSRKIYENFEQNFEIAWENGSIEWWKQPSYDHERYLKPLDKIFNSQGIYKSVQEGKKYKKLAAELAAKSSDEIEKLNVISREMDKRIAKNEYLITSFHSILVDTVQKTIEMIQRRESRSAEELSNDISTGTDQLACIEETKDIGMEDEEDDEGQDTIVYNPLNLPLGWDGKPIPYWLYKLHGLGNEYKCEICGNYSYWGRRAFERHFQEWRHAFGMKCLKIPNTLHFKEITSIQDAIVLYEKLKYTAQIKGFNASQDIECEDSQGNVMSARAYQDLARQGLL